MAGHSKFKNIQHRKGAQDKKRAKAFTKVGREIQVAAKLGGPDADSNPRLRTAISAARAVNMPNERINKSIQAGVGGTDGEDYEEIRYEGYGPGGVAIIVYALTDNRNRTVGEVRAAFSKYGGSLGETNSVSFMFDQVGEILYPKDKASHEDMFEASVEAGAMDCQTGDDYHEIYCAPDDFSAVRDVLEEKFGEAEKAGLSWKPNTPAEVNEDQAGTLLKLIDVLEENDDVQNVSTNFEVSDDVMEKLLAAG